MKRLLLLSFLFTMLTSVFAQQVTINLNDLNDLKEQATQVGQAVTATPAEAKVESEVPDSTKLTAKEVYSDIKEGLVGLGKALKTPIDHVYEILVRQQIVYSITWLIVYLILICFCIFASVKLCKNEMGDGSQYFLVILFWFITLVCIFCSISDVITGFVNPEYGAIQDIVEFVSNIKNDTGGVK